MSFTNYLENAVLDEVFSKASIPNYLMYVALWIGNPGDSGVLGNEVSGGGYARKLTFPTAWRESGGGEMRNQYEIAFPEATGDWGVVTHFTIVDPTYGMIIYGALGQPRDILAGSIPKFAPDALVITLT